MKTNMITRAMNDNDNDDDDDNDNDNIKDKNKVDDKEHLGSRLSQHYNEDNDTGQ